MATGVFTDNWQSGLIVYSGGYITLTNVTANGNKTEDGAQLTNNSVSGYDVLVDPSTFSDNWQSGLIIYSGGNITLMNVTATGNKTEDGAQLTNNSVSGYDVLVATGVFTDNWQSGLIIYSGGNITLTNVTANGNKTEDGAQLTNNSVSGYDVLVATGVFTDNWQSGLIIYSGGNITLTSVTANGNKTGDGADLTNNGVSGYDVLVDPSDVQRQRSQRSEDSVRRQDHVAGCDREFQPQRHRRRSGQ